MNESNSQKLSFLDVIIVVLSIYVLIALLFDSYYHFSEEVTKLLILIDNVICFIFIFDFSWRLYRSKSKKNFLKWGWIDLISSIPTFDLLRYGRLVRLFRLLRILRAFRSVKFITKHLFKNRTQGTFATVSFIAFLMIMFGSIAILQVEVGPNANIKTAEDAIWWSFVTTTTVGYGDKFPVTTEGRVISAFLMVTGVGLFGTFTGFVSAWFVGEERENKIEKK